MQNLRQIFNQEKTAGGREYVPPTAMWEQTKPRMRVMVGVAAFTLVLVLAYALRPNNIISEFWAELGIQPSFVALTMGLSAVGGLMAYFWWRTQWSIIVSLSGLIFFLMLIIWQTATTGSLAMFNAVTAIGVITLFGLWMNSASEEEALDQANRKLSAQIESLEAELNRQTAELAKSMNNRIEE